MEEDDWLDDDNNEFDPISLDSKSHAKIQSERETEGYRTGLNDGKEKTLQSGFNTGYKLAIDQATSLAEIRGKLVAFLSFRMSKYCNKDKIQGLDSLSEEKVLKIEEMVEVISEMERKMQEFKYDPKKLMAVKCVENSKGEVQRVENSNGKLKSVEKNLYAVQNFAQNDIVNSENIPKNRTVLSNNCSDGVNCDCVSDLIIDSKSGPDNHYQQISAQPDNKLYLYSACENDNSRKSAVFNDGEIDSNTTESRGQSSCIDNDTTVSRVQSSGIDAHQNQSRNFSAFSDPSFSQLAATSDASETNNSLQRKVVGKNNLKVDIEVSNIPKNRTVLTNTSSKGVNCDCGSDLIDDCGSKSALDNHFQQISAQVDNDMHLYSVCEKSAIFNDVEINNDTTVSRGQRSGTDAHENQCGDFPDPSISQLVATSDASETTNSLQRKLLKRTILEPMDVESTCNLKSECDEMEYYITSVLGVELLIKKGNVLLSEIGLRRNECN